MSNLQNTDYCILAYFHTKVKKNLNFSAIIVSKILSIDKIGFMYYNLYHEGMKRKVRLP